MSELPWGRRYLMCPPLHFGVLYEINPCMHTEVRVDVERAMTEWERLRDNLRAGIQAFERSDWQEAFNALAAAEAAGTLSTEDLERLAEAAWWIGKSEECIKLRERVYTLYLASGD